MCAPKSDHAAKHFNWDGDVIIHECIVPSSRPAVGSNEAYEIDVREFLVTHRNEVIDRTLRRDVHAFVKTLPGADGRVFSSREAGTFDLRAHLLTEFVSETIAYDAGDAHDPWQFPDETLVLKAGDCEDRALLLASLLIESGVSSYNVRVVLGQVEVNEGKAPRRHDHVWVMYKSESGAWLPLEPRSSKARVTSAKLDYLPQFLWNDDHLWSIGHRSAAEFQHKAMTRAWSKLDPKFHGAVHQALLREALTGVAPEWVVSALERTFSRALYIAGPIVDDIDRDTRHYDPRDHFDNGYIVESWQRVLDNLQAFAHSRKLAPFARAAHAIADFYAHSSWGHFAKKVEDRFALYEPGDWRAGLSRAPEYTKENGFDLSGPPFSVNPDWKGTRSDIPALFKGELISGRYAQPHDTQPGLLNHLVEEGPTKIPPALLRADDFKDRMALPHHNEIAVDEELEEGEKLPERHLYAGKEAEYREQFIRRRNSAVAHIRAAFESAWNGAAWTAPAKEVA